MTHSVQAGARRVIPLLAAGLVIAIAIMAFVPAATSPPRSAAVGVHVPNYDVEAEEASPLTWYFRVHTGVELRDEEEMDSIVSWLAAKEYALIVDSLLAYHGDKISDERALKILEAIGMPEGSDDTPPLVFSFSTEYEESFGYWFHVRMNFEITDPDQPGLHKQFIRWVHSGNLGAIRGVLNAWQAQGRIRGARADSIVAQVKRPGPPRWLSR